MNNNNQHNFNNTAIKILKNCCSI